MAVTYHDKNYLVIDDFGEFRRSVKGIVQQLGGLNIDMAATATEAMEMCAKKRYDIVLSDYNLGDGQDGQQLFELLLHSKRVRTTTIYIMITAENTQAMVMGAIEHQPDAYLTKPFNKAALQTRLEKLIERKEITRPIDKLIDSGDLDTTIEACDIELQQKSKLAPYCIKIKAEMLEKLGQHEAAGKIYAEACRERPVPWALLGMGRIMLAQGDSMAAKQHFQMVVKQLPMLLAAQDGLAHSLLIAGEKQQAQRVLVQAVALSPKAAPRQAKLGEVALTNSDLPTATRAFRQAVVQGRFSIHKQPDYYLQLAHCLTENMKGNHMDDKRAADEALRALQEMEDDYKGDKLIQLRSALMQASVNTKVKRPTDAAASLSKAKKLAEQQTQTLQPAVAIAVADQFCQFDEAEIAKDIIQRCAQMYGDDPSIQAKMAEIMNDLSLTATTDQAVQFNSEGIGLFQQNKLDEAAMIFRRAIALLPHNISIVLNTAQVLLELAKRRNFPAELIVECTECLDRAINMPPDDKRYPRFQSLMRQLNQSRLQAKA